NLIPHKVLNIRGYICTCLALFFILDFIQLIKYQILQFHAFFVQTTAAGADTVSSRNDQISTY
ncbi:hypothetical protein, partial [Alistipes putredinis]|uniref:hypothetical protein n=1 Tax=Alistipes putredinis TaxID=28117 RepID=UPI003AF9E8DB